MGRAVVARRGSVVAQLMRADSNTYVAGDGHFVTDLYEQPVNYRAADGRYIPIRPELVAEGAGYRQAANGFGSFLPGSADGRFRLWRGSAGISFGVLGGAGSGVVSGAVEQFGDVLPGARLAVRSLSSGLAWQADLSGVGGSRVFSWRVAGVAGMSARLTRLGVLFSGPGGAAVATFAAPWAQLDGSGLRLPVRLSLDQSGDGWTISVRVLLPGVAGARAGEGAPVAGVGPDDAQVGGLWVPGATTYLAQATYCDLNSQHPATSDCGYGSTNAGGPYDTVGPYDHLLMNLDVADNIPAHVRVLQAYVGLALTGESSTSATDTVGVWQTSRAWTGAATWSTYDGTDAWSTPGGDLRGPELDVQSGVGAASINQSSPPEFWWDIHPAMQQWVDGNVSQTDGLIFTSTAGSNSLQFGNWSASSSIDQPDIRVYWEPRMGSYPGGYYDTQQLTDRTTAGVNVATGGFMLESQDVHLPGVAGLDLGLERYYNNQSNGDEDSLGYNWTMSMGADTFLVIPSDDENVIDYFDGTGDSEMFYMDPVSGQWISPPGSDVSVSLNGAYSTYDASSISLFFRHSGITETFEMTADASNKPGYLESVKDRFGNTISYSYNWSAGGQLSSIQDTYGDTTTVTWGTNGFIHTITDPAGRTYTYNQNSSGQLVSYVDPDGNTTSYSYDPSYGQLDRILTGAGNVTTVSYYNPGAVGGRSEVKAVERYVHPSDGSGPTRSYSYSYADGGVLGAAGRRGADDRDG